MTLLEKVKDNLILEHNADNELLQDYRVLSLRELSAHSSFYTDNLYPPPSRP